MKQAEGSYADSGKNNWMEIPTNSDGRYEAMNGEQARSFASVITKPEVKHRCPIILASSPKLDNDFIPANTIPVIENGRV